MYPYILCFCGRCVGDVYDLFIAMCEDKKQAAYEKNGFDADPNMFQMIDGMELFYDDVFDALGIHLECCRTRLITAVRFKDLY